MDGKVYVEVLMGYIARDGKVYVRTEHGLREVHSAQTANGRDVTAFEAVRQVAAKQREQQA